MASGRKAFHFDLDEDKLKALYPSESETGYKSAWGKIQAFMESNDFMHTQYSGYESMHGMDYASAFTVLESLQEMYPWFKDCAKVATVTNIGKRHDVLEHLAQKSERVEEAPDIEQEPPMVSDLEKTSQSQEHVTLKEEARAARAASKALDVQDGYAEPPLDKDAR